MIIIFMHKAWVKRVQHFTIMLDVCWMDVGWKFWAGQTIIQHFHPTSMQWNDIIYVHSFSLSFYKNKLFSLSNKIQDGDEHNFCSANSHLGRERRVYTCPEGTVTKFVYVEMFLRKFCALGQNFISIEQVVLKSYNKSCLGEGCTPRPPPSPSCAKG